MYTAQCHARAQFARMNLIRRQAIFFCLVEFFVVCMGGGFFLGSLQRLLGLSEATVDNTRTLLWCVYPSMVLRVVGDNMKAYLRGQGIINEMGLFINGCFVLFLGYSFLIMQVLGLGIFGYGLCLFLFEASSLLSELYFYYYRMDHRARNTKMPFSFNLFWLFCEGIKSMIPLLLTWVVNELTIIILTLNHSEVQLATYAVVSQVPETFI